MLNSRQTRRGSVLLALLLSVSLLEGAAGPAPQARRRARPTSGPTARAHATPAPFRAGEALEFRVLWSKYLVNAATLRLSVVEQRPFYGHPAWHFQALAHTISTMRIVFPLDDQFDSYTAPSDWASLQYELYLHEAGKQETSLYRMTTDDDPAPPVGTAVRVLPGTRDPLGLIYALRATDWQRTPEARVWVFDGRKFYEVESRLEASADKVSVPAGNFLATRIGVRVFERGTELAGTHFQLWLAHDAKGTPVLLEAELPLGSARVELVRAD